MYRKFLNQIKEEKNNLENCLLSGSIQDFITYKFLIGQIKGLSHAIDILNEIIEGEKNAN